MTGTGTKTLHAYWGDEPGEQMQTRLLAVIADQLERIADHLDRIGGKQ